MVGVRGKYTGCNTCHARKATCTNERPICQRCIKSGLKCEGYERPRVFIIGTPDDRGRCSSHPHRLLGASRAKARARAPKMDQNCNFLGQIQKYSSPLVNIPDAFLNRMQCEALHSNILSLESVHESKDGKPTMPSLMSYLPDLTKSSPALEKALCALYLIHMGVNKKDDRLVKESALANTQAMARVRMATINPRTSAKTETIAAAICLYLYEQVACTVETTGAWRMLFRGASYLVQRRGPAAYKDFADHHFFVRLFRNDAVFDAMSRRKSTFLADPQWCTVPWENIPKKDMDRLFDIQVLLPGIFEREEQLEKLPPSASRRQQATDLLDYCFEVDRKFDDWYKELHSRSKKPLFWSIPRQVHTEKSVDKLGFDMCSLFSTYFQFVDLNTAFLHSYYWAALSLFYRKIQHIHRFSTEEVRQRSSRSPSTAATESVTQASAPIPLQTFPSQIATLANQIAPSPHLLPPQNSPFTFQSTPSPSASRSHSISSHGSASSLQPSPPLDAKYSESSILTLAHLICQSLPFTLNRTLRSFGPDHSAWPIWTALQVFKRRGYREEMMWCNKMIEMWGREGWRFGINMGRMEWRE